MCYFFFFKQKTAYEMRISDWSSDVCSSDLRTRCNHIDDVGQIAEIILVYFDQAQTLIRILIQARLDQRGLPGAARTRQQHIISRQTLHKLSGILFYQRLLRADNMQIAERDWRQMFNRLQMPLRIISARFSPAKCNTCKIGRASCRERVCQYV